MSRRRRRVPVPPPVRDDAVTVRQQLARLAGDPEYLRIKLEMGEPLTPAEWAILETARAAARAAEGGGA